MEKSHLNQASLWLKAAGYILDADDAPNEKNIVSTALAIHAIIKANDALTFKFFQITAKRHDDAKRLFEDLVKKNFIKSEFASYRQIIQDAITNKSRAEYRIAYFSKKDAEDMIGKAERFIRMAETCLTPP
ncbi:TPA: HEPN domain-containing protein [Candidatus Woesearchaeota archaeon]|nr:HEPN domain-containing protein [Candidatus Woesearchaeota archaeon]